MNFKFILDKLQKPRENELSGKIPWKIKSWILNMKIPCLLMPVNKNKDFQDGIDFSNRYIE
jgi:hypothetical protein